MSADDLVGGIVMGHIMVWALALFGWAGYAFIKYEWVIMPGMFVRVIEVFAVVIGLVFWLILESQC